jgi:small subunit ribosomal protein S9
VVEERVLEQHYFYGTGRRKTAVARVRLYPGTGTIDVNGRTFQEVFTRPVHQAAVRQPLLVTETLDKFNVQVKVAGGGISAWADAIGHGIARALVAAGETIAADGENPYKPILRKAGLLTRDARIKERKKYGLKRARKAPQYTKR